MLRLTLEIVPFGDETLTRHIGTMHISRTTPYNNPENYTYRVYSADGEQIKVGQVEQHPYEKGAWELCRRALELRGLQEPEVDR